ncbi:hypothetical protein EIP86_001278 [Pleurotus ostreatoroseus]|nr:hypothetical protein EIP86_001278 [Pleurotus ostreatoroseus]
MSTSQSHPDTTKRNRHPVRTKFLYVSPEEASGTSKVALNARRAASEVYIKELGLTQKQNDEVLALYDSGKIQTSTYNPESEEDQLSAAALLAEIALDDDAQETYGNRWNKKWSQASGKGADRVQRVLYQCNCGYDHVEAGSKTRRHAVPFTGCLVHAEVTYQTESRKVLVVRGYFEHNEECKNAHLTHFPARPLHPAVYKVALVQLKDGASLPDIKAKNRQLFHARGYSEQPADLSRSAYRWLIEAHDTRTLYRQYHRMMGITTRIAAHINVDEWLDPKSPRYNKTLADAVFHYKPRADKGERFEVCIANKDMQDAAWKYAHHSQVLLDGTFGICNRKILLFIVMGIDEKKRGVPLAFMLFSARSEAKQASASYDSETIQRLLTAWKTKLGSREDQVFTPYVAITDTDLVERNALAAVFPEIWLLICKFHLRQSWRNHRNRVLKGTSPLSMEMKVRMKRIEDSLVHTTSHASALAIIAEEEAVLAAHKQELDESGCEIIKHAEAHLLDYLRDWWCREALWQSWSDFGRAVAATRMGCAIDGVLPTTNHLESFNGVLKRGHLRRWQRGQKRLRLDVLVNILVTQIIPSIFEQRALEAVEELRWEQMVSKLPGGKELVESIHSSKTSVSPLPVAYLVPDESRDNAAQDLLKNRQLGLPTVNTERMSLDFECYSSIATVHDTCPTKYQLHLTLTGRGSCTCPDFQLRGGACKHLRAALCSLASIRVQYPQLSDLPSIVLPSSEADARRRDALDVIASGSVPREVLEVQTVLESSPDQPLKRAAAVIGAVMEEDGVEEAEEQVEDSGSEDEDADVLIPAVDDGNDTESVATDAPADDDDFDFTIAWSTARASVATQSLARALFELSNVAPKLAYLGKSLRGAEIS